MAERLDAASHLCPLRLLDGFARQLDHHPHAVGRGDIEQFFEARVGGIDCGLGIAGGDGVTVRCAETGFAHLGKISRSEKPDDEMRLAADAQKSVRADGDRG